MNHALLLWRGDLRRMSEILSNRCRRCIRCWRDGYFWRTGAILLHQRDDFARQEVGCGCADIWMRNRINSSETSVDVCLFEHAKPVGRGSGVRGIDGIAIVGRGVTNTAAYTARVAVVQSDARRAIVRLRPPYSQGER